MDNSVKTPEFSPIELLFNSWKGYVHHRSYDTEYLLIVYNIYKRKDLIFAIVKAASNISRSDVLGFYKHAFGFVSKQIQQNDKLIE